tara:strand:+ start:360 stop:1844 length:1485 start_codon:yes stop_codon:yes gene_type:complete
MSFFRFPEKIPNLFYLIYGLFLTTIAASLLPYFVLSDYSLLIEMHQEDHWAISNLLDLHLLILSMLYFFLDLFVPNDYLILRIINLIYSILIIYISYKIIKLKFYDLDVWSPLITIAFSGVIISLFFTLQNYLASGLTSLIIFYFLLKIFEEENLLNNLLFTFFSLATMLMGNFFFLIIITVYSLIKISGLKLQKEKRLNFISNLSLIYIIGITLFIIQNINYESFSMSINLSINEITGRIAKTVILLLPLFGVFFISLFFNIFKKLNWNKDLLLFLVIILVSLLIFIFSNKINYSSLVFLLPFFVIYIYRTLEFVDLKFSKFIYIFMFVLPILIIYVDTSLYKEINDIPVINYIFYTGIIFVSLFNPIFVIHNQSLINTQKIAIFSFLITLTIAFGFFYSQYNKQLIQNVIPMALADDFACNLDSTRITSNKRSQDIEFFYFKNLDPNFKHTCHIQLNFTSLNDLPIDDIKSVNKTFFDMNSKSFINLNIKKL